MLAVRPKSLLPLLVCMISGLCFMGCGPRLSPNVDFIPNITYAQGYVSADDKGEDLSLKALKLDILTPNDNPSPNKPAVLMIHGGGFDGGSRDDEQLVALADRLASEGYVCFLIDYRLKDDNPPAPPSLAQLPFISDIASAVHASFVDTSAALRFIKANASRYGINPDRIAMLGESAGGVAASGVGYTATDRFQRDREDLSVPGDNNPDVSVSPRAILNFWGSSRVVVEGLGILQELGNNDPPTLLIHGEADLEPFVTFFSATWLRSRLEEAGVPHRFVPLPGEGHGAWDARVDGEDLADIALAFLDEYL